MEFPAIPGAALRASTNPSLDIRVEPFGPQKKLRFLPAAPTGPHPTELQTRSWSFQPSLARRFGLRPTPVSTSVSSRSALKKLRFLPAAPTGPHPTELQTRSWRFQPALARRFGLRPTPVSTSVSSRSALKKLRFLPAAPTGPHPTELQTRSRFVQAIPGGRRGIICKWRGLASFGLIERDSHFCVRYAPFLKAKWLRVVAVWRAARGGRREYISRLSTPSLAQRFWLRLAPVLPSMARRSSGHRAQPGGARSAREAALRKGDYIL